MRRAAVLSALLLLGAAPPSPFPWLVFVALVPWVRAARALELGAAARAGAWLFGVYWGAALLWIPQAGLRVGAWTLAAWLAVVLTLTLIGAAFGALLHLLHRRARWPLPLALSLAWVAVEVARTDLLGPLSFGWLGIALPLTQLPSLLQAAAWVGEAGLALGVVAINGAVVGLVSDPGRGRRREAFALVCALMLVAVFGARRIASLPLHPQGSWVVVQPAVPLEARRGPAANDASIRAVEAHIDAAGRLARAIDAWAVVLPETVLEGAPELTTHVFMDWQRRAGVPLITGVEGRLDRVTATHDGQSSSDRAGAAARERRTNAVAVFTPAGAIAYTHKVWLVPGVERRPGDPDGWVPGARPQPLTVERLAPLRAESGPDFARTVGALVCIESTAPGLTLELARDGVDLLVNVTNDAWLAEAEWWTRSPAFAQHPAHLVLRSVEVGISALRVGNNGRTELIDPLGRRMRLLPDHQSGIARADAVRHAGPTPYVQWGWVVRWLIVAASLAGMGVAAVSPSREPRGVQAR